MVLHTRYNRTYNNFVSTAAVVLIVTRVDGLGPVSRFVNGTQAEDRVLCSVVLFTLHPFFLDAETDTQEI